VKITLVTPQPPPREVCMTFPMHQGWAIVSALDLWAKKHPTAQNVDLWRTWAKELDELLRRDESNTESKP
jgi:hypothetical protein